MKGLFALLPVVLFAACAKVGDITGGPKDELAPILLDAYPPALSTGFQGDRIVLQFNERIQLDRPKDRMLVSPPLDAPPIVRLSGPRTVTIELKAPLKASTTYTFGIGEAVKDLSEGNLAAGVVHVFSTGDVLDSLAVIGSVENAFSGSPEKEVLVLLYNTVDTGNVRTARPAYATRSDANGRFALQHLRAGSYRLHALRDKNANFRFDLPNEEIAFLDGTVHPTAIDSTMPTHLLRLFAESSPVQQVREAKVIADGAIQVVFARPATTVSVQDIARTGGRLDWYQEWSSRRDSLLLWPSDTVALGQGRYVLSVDGEAQDTLRYRPLVPMPFFIGLQAGSVDSSQQDLVRIRATRPLRSLDPALVRLVSDSVELPFTLRADSSDLRTWWLQSELGPGRSATLTILPKAARDPYNGSNDTLRVGIGRSAEQSTGMLRVRLSSKSSPIGPYIVQLLNTQGQVVREERVATLGGEIIWQPVRPGNHTLRVVWDVNGNGRWDTGVLDAGRQPERVWLNNTPINVRAAWDLGVDWELEP